MQWFLARMVAAIESFQSSQFDTKSTKSQNWNLSVLFAFHYLKRNSFSSAIDRAKHKKIPRVKREREIMQKIVLFIEHTDIAYFTPETIGNLFINRFAIDEDDSSEILNIFELVEVKRSIINDFEKGLDNFIVRKRYRFWRLCS